MKSANLRPPASIRLFLYGTLKRGFPFHASHCQGALAIQPALVRGRLYRLSAGIPILEVPPESVLARATDDPLRDAEIQEHFEGLLAEACKTRGGAASGAEWHLVSGELMTFPDPVERLALLDEFEEFYVEEEVSEGDAATNTIARSKSRSVYVRVLVTATLQHGGHLPAWVYVAPGRVRGLDPVPPGPPEGVVSWKERDVPF